MKQKPRRFRSVLSMIGLVLAASAVPIGVVLAGHVVAGIPIGSLTRDPTAVAGVPPYVGFLSQIGLFVWAATATVCLYSAAILARRAGRRELTFFLLAAGLISLLLGLDDAFLLHETVYPDLGIPEQSVLASYGAIYVLHVVAFRATIRRTDYPLLGLALLFFAISMTVDLAIKDAYLFEDGAKLVGLVGWFAYHARVGYGALTPQTPRVSAGSVSKASAPGAVSQLVTPSARSRNGTDLRVGNDPLR